MDSEPVRSASAVRDDAPPEYWGDHDANVLDRVVPRWVLATWAMCVGAGLAIALVATIFAAAVSESPLTGETNTNLGLLTIVAAMSTFIGFAVVLTMRLVKVEHDRLVNSLAVAAVHVLMTVGLFAVELILQSLGIGVSDIYDGAWTDEVGNAFTVLERSSAAAILGALLAVGMVPARGDRPAGTQTGATPQDRQL